MQEIESPESGYFHIIAQPGETLKVDSLIAQIFKTTQELDAEFTAPISDADKCNPVVADSSMPSGSGSYQNNNGGDEEFAEGRMSRQRIIASPLAKKMARDNDVDLLPINGTGPNGRIIKQDVLAAITRRSDSEAPAATSTGMVEKIRIPQTGMRKTIAANMKTSLQQTAQASLVWESDITELLALRKRLVQRTEQLQTKVSFNSLILKAITHAIREVPIANTCLQNDELVIYDTINIGIAVSVPGVSQYDSGLLVPVLKEIGRMGLVDIDKGMKDLIQRARNNALSPDELTGSTITMTSTAGLAPPGCQSTPILNLPNAMIINPSTPIEKPVVRDGEITVRTLLPVSLTFDHCLLDGDPAARFASALHECLENPELLLV